ncbi:mechanosensitive ion channel family protein [Polaribacter vadi]|uniref:mechanosensitive ion channel family protein n=1 Tax=Polaribacter TaxID=52959 RepID=UPI001C093CE1|nr:MULTISPECIES: mechanosensitive ion channel family protein [Polaribacter]MBU3010421.1 mechanosensitive ion channel family protein [Polaribacter vadi]MDO6740229.1 mechanosensitive ion channel family protein [Polaribacter sp. 1_MG-2023]
MKKLLVLIYFLSFLVNAQEIVKVDLSSPKSAVYTHIYFLQNDSYQPKKAAKTILGLPEKTAIEKAIKIKKVLDGKGLFIDFNRLPTNANYKDTLDYNSKEKYVLFPQRMPSIYVEKVENSWYYSSETVASIDRIYKEVFPWYVDKFQDFIPNSGYTKVLGIELWQFVAVIILFILAFVIFLIFKKITYSILQKLQHYITKSNSSLAINTVLKKLAHPISLLVAIKFIDTIFPSLQFSLTVNKWVFLAINIAETVFWIYVFLKLVKVIMKIYEEFTSKTDNRLDDQLVPILNNLLTGVVLIFGFFKVLQLFGVDTTTILAGATIGGLAFALASQDTVKNFIGTVAIFLDKPFHIDDWISAGEVTGTVEEVGFRSTRVRAADTTVYQIPNSKLAEMVINNSGLRLYRRYNTNLGLRYDTPPELIEAFVNGVRIIIKEHPETKSDSYNVEFTGFGDSALLVMMNVYFKSLAWSTEQSSKHRLHMAILKLAAELGVEFAFPSTTVSIEQFPDKSNLSPKYNTDKEKIKNSLDKVLENFRNDTPPENTPES